MKTETILRIIRVLFCGFGSAGLTISTGFPPDAVHSYIVMFASAIVLFYAFNIVLQEVFGVDL